MHTQLSRRLLKSGLYMTVCWAFIVSGNLQAQNSLWQKRNPRKAFLFQDLKARHIGDSLMIAIDENTDVANTDVRGMNKQTSINGSGGFSYGGVSSGAADVSVDSASQRGFTGDVNFSSDRQFQDRFSVTVVDVLQNGNLVVTGSRQIMVHGDRTVLSVSGIIRPEEIRDDNSVLSSRVARLKIDYSGQGKEQAFTKQGWLGNKMNKFWPF